VAKTRLPAICMQTYPSPTKRYPGTVKAALEHQKWETVFRRDKRGTRLRGDLLKQRDDITMRFRIVI
jgi:hypothetical protein